MAFANPFGICISNSKYFQTNYIFPLGEHTYICHGSPPLDLHLPSPRTCRRGPVHDEAAERPAVRQRTAPGRRQLLQGYNRYSQMSEKDA